MVRLSSEKPAPASVQFDVPPSVLKSSGDPSQPQSYSLKPSISMASRSSAPLDSAQNVQNPSLAAISSTRFPERSSSCIPTRSAEHTSELQSLMRISYAVYCLKKSIPNTKINHSPN